MTTNNTNNEMLTVNTDSVAPECRNLDVMMTGNDTREDLESTLHDEMYKSEALRRYAEKDDLRLIDLLLATIDDANCDGLPEDSESALHDEMYKSEALRRYAEENDLRVIDLLLATIDDTDCDGLPGYDRHWSSEIQLSDTVVQTKH